MIYLQISEAVLPVEDEPSNEGRVLESAAQEALAYTNTSSDAEVTIVLTDDGQIQELNRQFLDVDASTDVLSFPSGETDPDSEALYLGDIIISYPRALAQAQTGGHSVNDELSLLVVHGILHLLGYDHTDEDEKTRMWEVQAAILKRLGCSILTPSQE